jgi:hypothetical protein
MNKPYNVDLPYRHVAGLKIKRIPEVINEHYPELQSVLALNSFPGGVSASRKQMNGNNLGQIVVVAGVNESSIQTGMERRYAKTTFSTKMPSNGKILKIISRYKNKEGIAGEVINHNPQTVVIFESDGGEIGMFNLTDYCSYHPYLGFNYVKREAEHQIAVNNYLKKGIVFRDSPGVTEAGNYMYGVECNVAFMSHPAVSEDGILINRNVLKKFEFKTYETRVVEFGSESFPLNLYCKKFDEHGRPLEYKIHPEIGEYIREDGILMALRTYDENLAVVEQNAQATLVPEMLFDKLVYVAGAGGKIIDIRVHHETNDSSPHLPPEMEQQTMKYDVSRREFYDELYRFNNDLQRRYGAGLNLSKELHRLMVEAISVVAPGDLRVQKVNKRVPLDTWRIEFVVEYTNTPNIGNKFTDNYGGKGVVCHIAEPHEMPVDADGNVADFVFDPGSTLNRMIVSRLYEQYFKAASRDVLKRIIIGLGVNPNLRPVPLKHEMQRIQREHPEKFEAAWSYLISYYRTMVPEQAKVFEEGRHGSTPLSHLTHIISEGIIVLQIRPDHPLELKNMVADVEESFAPTYGPVSYIGYSGKRVTTRKNVRVAPMTILMLEKIADSWSAVSSARLQHFGVLATMSNADKYSQPIRHNPTRALGESELRILTSYAGGLVAAEMMDRNNNIASHKEIVLNILKSATPTNIELAVDRNKIPLGGSKPSQLVKHIMSCGGCAFAFEPYKPAWTVGGAQQH